MNFRGLDLNLLVAMDALLTERSTTRAGERIYLSQSAMSGALARLRAFFDDELLIQVGQRMVLTPLAEDLVNPVREALLAIEKVVGGTFQALVAGLIVMPLAWLIMGSGLALGGSHVLGFLAMAVTVALGTALSQPRKSEPYIWSVLPTASVTR